TSAVAAAGSRHSCHRMERASSSSSSGRAASSRNAPVDRQALANANMSRAGSNAQSSAATRRILDAAARRIAVAGAAALSIHEVAVDAGVSKALVHYHFRDKDTLLARLVEHLANALVERERQALASYA